MLSCVTTRVEAQQALLCVRFSRGEHWSGLPIPFPRDLPYPGLLHCRRILHQLLGSQLSPLQCHRTGFHPWVVKILWLWKQQPTPVFLLGESHGQEPGGPQPTGSQRESDMTEHACTPRPDSLTLAQGPQPQFLLSSRSPLILVFPASGHLLVLGPLLRAGWKETGRMGILLILRPGAAVL